MKKQQSQMLKSQMIDPRTEAIKAPIDGKNYLLISEHQILGKW